MASPAKLQAAATLAEVANGIEGEVSHFGAAALLIMSVEVKRGKEEFADSFCSHAEASPSASSSEACREKGEPVV